MPTMNGIEAARCLRQLLPSVPIIIFSDYGGLFPDQEARSAGIDAIVSKAECSSVLPQLTQGVGCVFDSLSLGAWSAPLKNRCMPHCCPRHRRVANPG